MQGKIAIVTGGASGIGFEIARQMTAEGATVVIADIRRDAVETATRQIAAGTWGTELDVRVPESWKSLMDEIAQRYGRLDILVNNAAIAATENVQDIETVKLEDWRAVQRVNVEGVLLGCQYGIRAMRATGGSIINMASIAALVATPGLAAYGASKASVTQITKSVAMSCARRGYHIRCNSIHPGLIATGLFEATFTDDEKAERLESIPLGEFGRPEDVAAMAVYLASDQSAHVTGARFMVDGGMTMA